MSSLSPPDSGKPDPGEGSDAPRDALRALVIFCIAFVAAGCVGLGAGAETAALLIAAHLAMTLAVIAGVAAGLGAASIAGLTVAGLLSRLIA
jgi:hypothetical protein